MQKYPEIYPGGVRVVAEDPPTRDSERKGTLPGGGVPGLGGPGGAEGPGGPADDWDQEASLAAFVAEVGANRKPKPLVTQVRPGASP